MACSCQKRRRGRRSNISGMKMKKGSTGVIITGAKVAGGFVAGRFVSNMDFFKQNQWFGIGAQAVGAILLGSMKGANMQEAAVGMAASAVVDTVRVATPSTALALGLNPSSTVGFLPTPQSGSTLNPGVAGVGEYGETYFDDEWEVE
jgi:hypothetical protein